MVFLSNILDRMIVLLRLCLNFLTSSLKKHTFYNLLINNILYFCVT